MKNKSVLIIFLAMIFAFCINLVSAEVAVSVDNYYPSPVEAGDYFDVWLSITNSDGIDPGSFYLQFKESYPFSLNPGQEDTKTITNLGNVESTKVNFKIRTDAAAAEGDNQLYFQYKTCPGCTWTEIGIPITVVEVQTGFDIVLQEVNEEGVYFAIANIGKNTANAVTVRIPEQDYFQTKMISASIIGNLESGDYTLVSFEILPKDTNSLTKEETKQDLTIQIDYTDVYGARRSVFKNVELDTKYLTSSLSAEDLQDLQENSKGRFQGPGNNSSKTSLFIVIAIIIAAAITGLIFYKKKFKKQKTK